jgi:hypothetical protein
MRALKGIIVAAAVTLALVFISSVAQAFCLVSVAVFAVTSLFGLAAKLRT